jgi:hypothetical protein
MEGGGRRMLVGLNIVPTDISNKMNHITQEKTPRCITTNQTGRACCTSAVSKKLIPLSYAVFIQLWATSGLT